MSKITGFDDLKVGQLKALVTNLGGVEMVEEINSGRLLVKLEPVLLEKEKKFRIFVDYDGNLKKAIKAGKYDYVNENIIQDNFPQTRSGKEEIIVEFFHFGRCINSDDALNEIQRKGYRLANIMELLALGSAQPELQQQFPIVALGSVWFGSDGDRFVPFLCRCAGRRLLDLFRLESGWDGCCRFAVVRELS